MGFRSISCMIVLIVIALMPSYTELEELSTPTSFVAPDYEHVEWNLTYTSTSHSDEMLSNTMEIPFQSTNDFDIKLELKAPSGNNSWEPRVHYYIGLIQIDPVGTSDEGYINSSTTGITSIGPGQGAWVNTTVSAETLEWGRCYQLAIRLSVDANLRSYVLHPLYIEYGTTTPYDAECPRKDSDGDGFTDNVEILYSTNASNIYSFPLLPDSDADGVPDNSDACNETEVSFSNVTDHDGDGCWPGEDTDLDNDNISNEFDACDESPIFPANNFSVYDYDGDGCLNFIEDLDSDDDGYPDLIDYYPLDNRRHAQSDDDADDDYWTDVSENWFGTDPNDNTSSPDMDGDYWADIHEISVFESFNQTWILSLIPSNISDIYLNSSNPWDHDADLQPGITSQIILDAIELEFERLSNSSDIENGTCDSVPCTEFVSLQNQFELFNQSLNQILVDCGAGCDEDGDAVIDSVELICNTDPFNSLSRPDSYLWITNQTGSISIVCNFNPNNAVIDSDQDGFSDTIEQSCQSDPTSTDSVPNGAWIEFVDGSLVCRTGITTLPASSEDSGVDAGDLTAGIVGGGLLTAGGASIFNRWRARRPHSSKNNARAFEVVKDLDLGFRGRGGPVYRHQESIRKAPLIEENIVYGDSDQYTERGTIRQASLASSGNIDGEMDYRKL